MVYVGNVTGRSLRSAEAISEDLAINIAHGVRWYDATTLLTELGCRLFLEMPPGHVLSELGREAFPDVRTLAAGETSFKHVLLLASQFGVAKLPATLARPSYSWTFLAGESDGGRCHVGVI